MHVRSILCLVKLMLPFAGFVFHKIEWTCNLQKILWYYWDCMLVVQKDWSSYIENDPWKCPSNSPTPPYSGIQRGEGRFLLIIPQAKLSWISENLDGKTSSVCVMQQEIWKLISANFRILHQVWITTATSSHCCQVRLYNKVSNYKNSVNLSVLRLEVG